MNGLPVSDCISRLAAAAPVLVAIADEGSLSRAALRLGLHQTAVSHRVKSLEDMLGHAIFLRTTRSLEPTAIGRIVLEAAQATASAWSRGLDRIAREVDRDRIVLNLSSSLAMKWLIPALGRAQEVGIELSLDVQDHLVAPRSGVADVSLRFGPGPYPGHFVAHLSDSSIIPVARPGLVEDPATFRWLGPDGPTLLGDRRGARDGTGFSWSAYCGGLDSEYAPPVVDVEFDRADLMLQAAIGGAGIALGRRLLVENDIEAGLLEPIGPPVRMASKYWLVTAADFAATATYARLLHWLRDEVSRTAQLVPAPTATTP
ncbi:MAG: LysR family transcriptional regulator [Azoarcus sp.]|nr:LysR family transcriptional regulator [Azoarcus sp.]